MPALEEFWPSRREDAFHELCRRPVRPRPSPLPRRQESITRALPAAGDALGLAPAVAGAWIGGNIDTTAAVSAAGAIVGEEALQIATTTQNALLEVVAVALTAYFTFRVERSTASARPRARELWERFPTFVRSRCSRARRCSTCWSASALA